MPQQEAEALGRKKNADTKWISSVAIGMVAISNPAAALPRHPRDALSDRDPEKQQPCRRPQIRQAKREVDVCYTPVRIYLPQGGFEFQRNGKGRRVTGG